jgi:uncharacterized protein (TIGR03067 family)
MIRSLSALCAFLAVLVPVPEAEPVDDVARAQGHWQIVLMQENGNALTADEMKVIDVAIVNDQITWRAGSDVFAEYRFTFDLTKQPRHADFVGLSGDLEGKRLPGIYQFDQDLLKVAVNIKGGARPRSLDVKDAQEWNLVHLRRKPR